MELKPDIPLVFVDMTVGNESSRITKVKHQGFMETVRVLNSVLRKMNAEVTLEVEPVYHPLTFEIPDFPDLPDASEMPMTEAPREKVGAANDT